MITARTLTLALHICYTIVQPDYNTSTLEKCLLETRNNMQVALNLELAVNMTYNLEHCKNVTTTLCKELGISSLSILQREYLNKIAVIGYIMRLNAKETINFSQFPDILKEILAALKLNGNVSVWKKDLNGRKTYAPSGIELEFTPIFRQGSKLNTRPPASAETQASPLPSESVKEDLYNINQSDQEQHHGKTNTAKRASLSASTNTNNSSEEERELYYQEQLTGL